MYDKFKISKTINIYVKHIYYVKKKHEAVEKVKEPNRKPQVCEPARPSQSHAADVLLKHR